MKLIKQDTCNNNPWAELDRIFERAFPVEHLEYSRAIPVSSYATDDERVIELELPGVDKKDLNLSFERGILDVSATRKLNRNGETKELKLEQSIRVGTEINTKKASAALENGILTIRLPRREQDKPYTISVN
jgi:HSP20 family protein